MFRRSFVVRFLLRTCVVVLASLLGPSMAWAQSNSSIAGVVKDDTGAVLPGVTVEASSPALIEKVRTAVTDSAGQYKIVNLVPGCVRGHLQRSPASAP